jgi:hypothetical protein
VAARLRSIVPYAVMLGAAAWLYGVAARIDVDTGGRISPAAWPKAILAILALLCVYEIVRRLVTGREQSTRGLVAGLEAGPEATKAAEHPERLWGGIALVAAYVFGVQWLGFFLSTALFLGIFPWVGGVRRPILAATLGLAGALTLVVVFMRVAYISLPLGEGPFRALSIALLRLLGVT